ncbi:MAG TPA: hypothetical protein VJX92_02705 [Methylomirabilota bacterium]|nr:hypothetical protein [Methylomirabilota bacterium]
MDHTLDIAVAIATMFRPAVLAVLLMGLWAGVHRTELPPRARIATWLAVAVPLVGWFVIAEWLGRSGVYEPRPDGLPLLPIAIALPLTVGLVLALRSSRLAAVLDAIPQSWLIGVQVYRVLGLVILIQLARGLAPWQFALPAGIGDVLTGLFALPVAASLIARPGDAGPRAVAWNLFGITDLVVALTLGALTSPGPLQALAFDHPNQFFYPLVMIPTFAVPWSIILHGLSLRQIARRKARTDRVGTLSQIPA